MPALSPVSLVAQCAVIGVWCHECLQIFRPTTLEEVRSVTETCVHHDNHERPHQGRSCGNQPPCVARLPRCPSFPALVDLDTWLTALDGRYSPRRVQRDGRIVVDGLFYYVKAALAGLQVLLRLNATTRCFEVWMRVQCIKELLIKVLRGEQMPLEASIELMRERV